MGDPHEQYTHGHHESVLRAHSWRTVENSAAYLVPELRPGRSLLDVGCGPGTITVDFARRLAPGRVTGLDASAEIIGQATELGAGLAGLEFVTGDAYALPFDDDTFDIVHAHQVLQHVADPVAVLRELRRVAKSDGVVAVRDVDYGGTIWYPELQGLDDWIEVLLAVHRSNGGEPDAGRRLQAWALEAGFGEVQATASIWCFANEEDRAWWGGLWSARILESDVAAAAIAKGIATRDDLQRISATWLDWAARADATLFMPHGEVIARG